MLDKKTSIKYTVVGLDAMVKKESWYKLNTNYISR